MDRREFLSASGLALGAMAVTGIPGLGALATDPRISPAHGHIALTFDDGPGGDTNQCRHILDQTHVKGTFFMVGTQIERHYDSAKGVARAGHSIQNHSWSHADLTRQKDPIIDIRRCNKLIRQVSGEKPTYFRPPYGATNKKIQNACKTLGLKHVLWNISSTYVMSTRDPVRELVRQANTYRAKGRTAIVLFHDVSNDRALLNYLPKFIAALKTEHYQFVTLG